MNRTLLYWPEAADDPVVSWLLDEVEIDDPAGPEDPDPETPESGDENKQEEEDWAPLGPSAAEPEDQLD